MQWPFVLAAALLFLGSGLSSDYQPPGYATQSAKRRDVYTPSARAIVSSTVKSRDTSSASDKAGLKPTSNSWKEEFDVAEDSVPE
ncbi:MAG: hypothetical protein M1831_003799 [Alyxoria varia]|nr:MAG: hypothetical protein M1831_003799 [Alyxoria varia]